MTISIFDVSSTPSALRKGSTRREEQAFLKSCFDKGTDLHLMYERLYSPGRPNINSFAHERPFAVVAESLLRRKMQSESPHFSENRQTNRSLLSHAPCSMDIHFWMESGTRLVRTDSWIEI